jgi:hypothetical protein
LTALSEKAAAVWLAQLPVEDQPLRRPVGEAAADIGQPGFGQCSSLA